MSDWTKIRDSIVEALKVEEVGSDLKNKFVGWLHDEGVAFAQKFVDKIVEECEKDAPNESGWCKIRDSLVVPTALNIAMYILKMVLDKAAAEAQN